MRVFGGSLGVASSFIVLNQMVQDRLADILTAEQLAAFYQSPVAIYGFAPLQQVAVRGVYIDTFNLDMRVCAGISAACILAAVGTYQSNPPTIKKRLQDLEELYARSAALTTETM